MRRRKGVTLIELMLTLAIVGLVLMVVYSVLFAGTTSHSISTSKGFAQQDIRIASDFLTNELRYVTDISDEDYAYSEYYSLRINNEGKLVKTKHVYQVDDSVVETILRTVPGNMDSFNISNNASGVINVDFEQIEKTGSREAGFELGISITTENSPDMLSNVSVDLVNGDVLYYKNTMISSLAHSIYLQKLDVDDSEVNVTVQFWSNNGTGDDGTGTILRTIIDESGTTKSLPTNPTRLGFTFSGWYTNSDGTGISYGSAPGTFEMPSNNTNLYAKWTEVAATVPRVTINTASENDGIVSIDGETPEKSGSRFKVKTGTVGSDIQIKLKDYNASLHSGKVTVTVNNSTIAVEANGNVTFKATAGKNGNNEEFDVEIKIKTDGHDEYNMVYYFITDNKW
ncbi:MAG: InlB B-repeat-containing protein [Dethiosulfatibacter sp.]|nr:InlB B-repeat-containing protein [Dethiosulfatibacter sp.]